MASSEGRTSISGRATRTKASWPRGYELDTIAVSVVYMQAGRFEHRRDLWHPHSRTSSKRFQIADFMYSKRTSEEAADPGPAPSSIG
jgi:hypothetical protein